MKRNASRNENGLRAALPLDIMWPVAWQLDLQDTVATFSFALVCKTAREALMTVLTEWYHQTKQAYKLAEAHIPADTYFPGTLHNRSWSHVVRYCDDNGMLNNPFCHDKVSGEYSLALYHIFHIRQLEGRWDCHRQCMQDERAMVHAKLHHTGLRLANVFYMDRESQSYRPLKRLPNLQTVEMETSRLALMQQLENHINRTKKLSSLAHFTVRGLKHAQSPLEYRPPAYDMLRSTLKHHKPRGKALLCTAVWQKEHLFRDCAAHDALKLRVFSRRGLSSEKKCRILDLRRSVSKRGRTLCKRVRELRPGPVDFNSESSSREDDEDEDDM